MRFLDRYKKTKKAVYSKEKTQRALFNEKCNADYDRPGYLSIDICLFRTSVPVETLWLKNSTEKLLRQKSILYYFYNNFIL